MVFIDIFFNIPFNIIIKMLVRSDFPKSYPKSHPTSDPFDFLVLYAISALVLNMHLGKFVDRKSYVN